MQGVASDQSIRSHVSRSVDVMRSMTTKVLEDDRREPKAECGAEPAALEAKERRLRIFRCR